MAHGYPDWGGAAPIPTVYGVQDFGEIPARLKSVVTFDRRGNIILMDDFEDGVGAWALAASGATYAFNWDAQYPYTGGFCAKMETPTDEDEYLQANRRFPYPVLSKLGGEVCFSYLHFCKYFQIYLYLSDGTYAHEPKVRWKQADEIWQVRDENEVWHDVGSAFKIYDVQTAAYFAKLVVDYENEKYVRLLVNNQTIDLSAYSYYKIATPTAPRGTLQIELTSRWAVAEAYIHHAIITQNEP